jgi:hypothetical protein
MIEQSHWAYECKHGNVRSFAWDCKQCAKDEITSLRQQVEADKADAEWISEADRLPDFIEGEFYSANVFGLNYLGQVGVYNIISDGDYIIWGRLEPYNVSDITHGNCISDDDYGIVAWMPIKLPNIDKEMSQDTKESE